MRGKAQHVARPAQTRLQNSGVTGSMFTKFLSDALRFIGSVLRFSQPQWNANAQKEGGYAIFSPIRAKSLS